VENLGEKARNGWKDDDFTLGSAGWDGRGGPGKMISAFILVI
jgi:hypothetical protein